MKRKAAILFLLFFCIISDAYTQVNRKDSLGDNNKPGRYLNLLPLVAGRWVRTDTKLTNDVLVVGLRLGQGVRIRKFNFGLDLSYDRVRNTVFEDIHRSEMRLYAEYHFYQFRKVSLHVGARPGMSYYSYTPEPDGYRFFNDPTDGRSKVHYVPAVSVYTGTDIRIRQRYHLLLGIGYHKVLTGKAGNIPDNTPLIFNLDFRTPFPKILMKNKSRNKNYY